MKRAGVALVFVLGLLVLSMAAATLWLRVTQRSVQALHVWQADTRIWAIEQAAEQLAISWLATQGGSLVAPPEGGSWPIITDRWTTADSSGWLTVVVYDGWSGIPPHLAGPRGALRRFVPGDFLGLPLDSTTPIRAGMATDLIACWDPPPGSRRFPVVPAGPAMAAQAWEGSATRREAVPAPDMQGSPSPCLATVFSPHSDGRINCNTAPLPLIEHILRMQGGLTLTDLRRNRDRGIMTLPPPDPGGAPGHALLVASSGVWNLHLTVAWQGTIRSWWVVVVGNTPLPRIVQRHAVDP